jgi:hypothetical protein
MPRVERKTVPKTKKSGKSILNTAPRAVGSGANGRSAGVTAVQPVSGVPAAAHEAAGTGMKDRSWKKFPRHGQTQVVAFARDPWSLFTYWEVAPETVVDLRRQWGAEFDAGYTVLLVFRANAAGQAELVQEARVEAEEMNRYVGLKEPDGSYVLEIGRRMPGGQYIPLARSNRVNISIRNGAAAASAEDPSWAPPRGMAEYFSAGAFRIPGGFSSAPRREGKGVRRGFYHASHL